MNKLNILGNLIESALKQGATAADAIIIDSTSLSTEIRLQKLISMERSSDTAVALRVMINQQQAIVSTSDFAKSSLDNVIEKAIAMAKVTPANPHLFLANKEQITKNIPKLELFDDHEPSANVLIEKATQTESYALDNKQITNSEGASAQYQANNIYFATSEGFQHSYQTSSSALSLEVLAGKDESMQTGGSYTIARFAKDLKSPEEIGREAAKQAVDKLNPRKIVTSQMPVIFDRKAAKALLGAFAGAINGLSISRGTSFLIDHLGQEIFNPLINIIDDPFINKGLASRPFDAEAISGGKLNIVEKGILNNYLLDLQTAYKLKMQTTGHASRGLSTAPNPNPSNMYIQSGSISLDEMIKSLKKGILITEIFGHGANIITGDYSQGIVGFYIENGEILYPISEMTAAGNLKSMFKQMIPANDLKLETSINSPSLMIETMTLGGL